MQLCALHREHVQGSIKGVKQQYSTRLEALLSDHQVLSDAAVATGTALSTNDVKVVISPPEEESEISPGNDDGAGVSYSPSPRVTRSSSARHTPTSAQSSSVRKSPAPSSSRRASKGSTPVESGGSTTGQNDNMQHVVGDHENSSPNVSQYA